LAGCVSGSRGAGGDGALATAAAVGGGYGNLCPQADGCDGGEWRLADHSGQVVLLNYWATWCEPCRDELPVLLKADREFAPQGLVMVGVSFDSGSGGARAQAVQSFVQRYRVPYAIAFPDARLYVKSSDMELPTTLLVDRHGRIAKTYHGEVDGVALEADIKMLLAES
jgi:cytochrome c biogenesis protein CcmG/thiol:disulfide interchange protein DsbE